MSGIWPIPSFLSESQTKSQSASLGAHQNHQTLLPLLSRSHHLPHHSDLQVCPFCWRFPHRAPTSTWWRIGMTDRKKRPLPPPRHRAQHSTVLTVCSSFLSMSQFSEARPTSGAANPQQYQNSMFSGFSDNPRQVSNLTKNLMSSGKQHDDAAPEPLMGRPPSFSASQNPLPNKFAGSELFGSDAPPAPAPLLLFTQNQPNFYAGNLFTPTNGNMNYIPLGRNTPTAVSSSYTSNYSITPSYHSAQGQAFESNPQLQRGPGFLPGAYKIPGAPTTTVSMDLANSNVSVHTPSSLYTPQSHSAQPHYPEGGYSLLPTTFGRAFPPSLRVPEKPYIMRVPEDGGSFNDAGEVPPPLPPAPAEEHAVFPEKPDHYMSYKEYLDTLNKIDSMGDEAGYEQHLNIVDFPVNDLITMLACLLTKIIEANDKLHPNHFENTIAVRQKLKERKRVKREERERSRSRVSFSSVGINTTVEDIGEDELTDDSADEEEDELKNRYLANVLAFHGTNVPGITLQAYLTRVLKYCPVTNEVFLSLLVYFDRIAKRVNNLKTEKNEDGTPREDGEQLFVMDSYNIHRLIILGITVSSKFFSDIFYKNLRYAKVGGLPLEELNYLELQFLLLLDFKLMISVEDLQNYGDLLLKFWKREQLTTELVGSKNGNKSDDAVEK